ncbi:hypothetical protein CEXT_112631 [Caerostris extrusa]|uniref:Uncharacterized protein n=1 Tax=Caerostris extrusa TaxID=172846 RepID=A0AAV4NVW2_CAEEX|nr:hypothetical protein CEXT_112631 [Caerostris extrusa]
MQDGALQHLSFCLNRGYVRPPQLTLMPFSTWSLFSGDFARCSVHLIVNPKRPVGRARLPSRVKQSPMQPDSQPFIISKSLNCYQQYKVKEMSIDLQPFYPLSPMYPIYSDLTPIPCMRLLKCTRIVQGNISHFNDLASLQTLKSCVFGPNVSDNLIPYLYCNGYPLNSRAFTERYGK